jgi:hypothetical protein|tara:strand:- start:322 stop:519 length:198 start_codon:yes stop_codon:yes gene_type:complete
VQLTTETSDRASIIKNAIEECLALEAAYSSVILGRKEFKVEYINNSGESVVYVTDDQLELSPEEK